ncbi:MAG: lipopolysaccharide biosynthesis protein [Bacteroidaceae bacterium]|nr:lipopolysaccharide biosynthesis protein [Bacteroidaceae bacterium]
MSKVDNKRIAKNTFYLYLRMLFVMAIGLYTVRAVLDILGVVDYGIYNVVGGVVTLFSFMKGTLSTSSQRYFSIELAHDNKERLNQLFCLNTNAFLVIGLAVAFFLETVGLWFVNTQMTIPSERLFAANVVYHLSVISFLFHIIVVPYMALVIAHEKMKVFAYIGVFEALGKLLIVFILVQMTYDKLIVYGILMLLLYISVSLSYIVYCKSHFPESKYRWYWNTSEIKELLGFSGWHFMGAFSTTCRSQGINILLNVFFDPAVNAARAIALQVNTHILQLSSNFFTAVKPQIYKSYAQSEMDELYRLIIRSSVICAFLVSLVVFPFLSNTPFILGLWLKQVPEYAVVFTQLAMINGLVDSMNGPTIAAALATGKIRKYMTIVSCVILAIVPISYVALKLGAAPTATMVISIIISFICLLVRAYLLQSMIGFPVKRYVLLILKILIVSVFLYIGIRFSIYNNDCSILIFSIHFLVIAVMLILLYSFVLEKSDRLYMISFIKNKLLK